MGIGTIITGLGFLFLAGAAQETLGSADGKASIYWMFAAYLLHVIGELSISPIALSYITKLAPAKYASFMMGAYFFVSGVGNKVAGLVGEAAQEAGEMAIFIVVFGFCALFGLTLVLFVKRLKGLAHGAEDITPVSPLTDPE